MILSSNLIVLAILPLYTRLPKKKHTQIKKGETTAEAKSKYIPNHPPGLTWVVSLPVPSILAHFLNT